MSILDPLRRAAEKLGVDVEASEASELKRGYRRALSKSPPDRDPEGFRAVRSAYETLMDPSKVLRGWIDSAAPHVEVPPSPLEAEPEGATMRAILRMAIASTRVDELGLDLSSPADKHSSRSDTRRRGATGPSPDEDSRE